LSMFFMLNLLSCKAGTSMTVGTCTQSGKSYR
jgi:hypothetical protein